MIKQRVQLLKKTLLDNDLDSFLVTNPQNCFYLSGFTGTAGVLLITKKNNYLITDFRYIEQAEKEAALFKIIKYANNLYETLYNLIKKENLLNLGFEAENVSFNQYQLILRELKGINLVPEKKLIENLRVIKDKEEVQKIKKAVEITDEAFNYILTKIKPGIREIDIATELEIFMRKQGASGTSFATIVASGERSALPHGVASEKIVEKGNFITLDFGCIYNNYCSDMTRTIVIGKPSRKQREIYEIVLEAQKLALEKIRAGEKACNIDTISRKYIESKGYGEFFGHGLGHSVGLDIHESPSLSPRDSTILKSNMTITVEPGIYLPQWGGVRIEDLVVVSEVGIENLTRSPKELISI